MSQSRESRVRRQRYLDAIRRQILGVETGHSPDPDLEERLRRLVTRLRAGDREGLRAAFAALPPLLRRRLGEPPDPPAPGQAPAETILVVDDDMAIRTLLRLWLDRAGYEVCLAPTATRALALLDSSAFDFALVLTDVSMPGMDGLALLSHLRQSRPDLPVLLMTGESRTDLPDGVLRKPFGEVQLLRAVRRTLRSSG